MTVAESHPMNGGDGPLSYAQNSIYQREVVDAAKVITIETIADKLEIKNTTQNCPNTIRIADFGCSVGPNTFIAVKNIIEAVNLKLQKNQENSQNTQVPEFQVFFNDHKNNDFNTLFVSLSPTWNYYAAGVPGSFYNRLFPNATLHIGHSSTSLHWLSKIPEELVDVKSPVWNKRAVHYTGNKKVLRVYSDQHKKDMEAFLSARGSEIVGGGIMVILIPGCEDGVLPSETCNSMLFGLFGDCLMDMAKMGLISEEKVDSFNIPMYLTSPKELKEVIDRNGHFSIERMENLSPYKQVDMPDVEMLSVHFRAAIEGLISEHFGRDQFMDELFQRYAKKMGENSFMFGAEYRKEFVIFACLKRNATVCLE